MRDTAPGARDSKHERSRARRNRQGQSRSHDGNEELGDGKDQQSQQNTTHAGRCSNGHTGKRARGLTPAIGQNAGLARRSDAMQTELVEDQCRLERALDAI